MNKQLACIIIAALLIPLAVVAETSYLFVGNSQTDASYLSRKFEGLATAGGHDVHVDKITVPGSTLSYHSHNQDTLDLIHERNWDHVILQEHSLLPVIEYWRHELFYPAAAKLDSIITASGSHTTLFAHWARKDASGAYCVLDSCSREFDDYFDMQQEMSSAFFPLAAELDCPLVLVGDAWATALLDEPELPLWGGDNLHASPDGAYFTACLFYVALFDESPVGLTFYDDVDPAAAQHYQQLALDVTTAVGDQLPAAAVVRSLSNHPNPFNPSTEIRFEVLAPVAIELAIFDARGRRVRVLDPGTIRSPGVQRVPWDGRDHGGNALPAGIYLVKLATGAERLVSKLTLLK